MRGSPLLGRLPGSGAPSSHPAIHNLLSLLSRGNMQQGIFRLCSALPRMFIRFGWGRAGEGGGCQPSLSLPWLQPGRSHVVREFYIQDSWLTLHSNKLILSGLRDSLNVPWPVMNEARAESCLWSQPSAVSLPRLQVALSCTCIS